MKYAYIKQWSTLHSISRLCRLLNVSRSGYYRDAKAVPNRYREANRQLRQDVERIHYEYDESYGTRRIKRVLMTQGRQVSRERIARAKRLLGLYTRRRRRHELTRRSRQVRPVIPNLLKRNFHADRPNQVWVADVTNVWTSQGWLYVAVVIDLFARRVVGWSSGRSANDTLTASALQAAIKNRKPESGLIHHSDRGAAYVSGRYQAILKQNNITASMSRPANCLDNAAVESFFSSLKNERTHHERYSSRADARESVYDYIECFYNPRRMHSTLGYLSPMQFERYARVT